MRIFNIKYFSLIKILIVLLLLSAFRNLTPSYYLILLGVVFLLSLKLFQTPIKVSSLHSIFYIFIAYTILIIFWSGLYMQSWLFLPGVPRVLIMPILTLFIISVVKTDEQVITLIRLILFCYVVASFTIIYQIIYGPIPWFADFFYRAGLDRYASILGSLTIYGSIVGYGLLLTYSDTNIVKNSLLKIILVVILSAGAFFSLTKSGIVMIALSLAIYILFNFNKNHLSVKKISLFIITITIIIALLITIPEFKMYYDVVVTQTIGGSSIFSDGSNVLIDSAPINFEHIFKRLFMTPYHMYLEYGNIALLIGVGLQGAAGTLGVIGPDGHYLSAHNSFGDLIFMGGVLYFLIFLIMYFMVQFKLFKYRNENKLSLLLFMTNILFLANLLISGSIFQPSVSILFWISFAYSTLVNKEYNLYQESQ